MKKILSILICVLVGIGNVWGASQYKITVSVTAVPEKSGTMSLRGGSWDSYGITWADGTQTGYANPQTTTTTEWFSSKYYGKSAQLDLWADAKTGYYFYAWSKSNDVSATNQIFSYNKTHENYEIGRQQKETSIAYYAIFKEQTAYMNYAQVEAVMVNSEDYPVMDGAFYAHGACYVSINKAAETDPAYTWGAIDKDHIEGIDANPEGTWEYKYYYSTNANNYEFVGWFEADVNGNLPTVDGKLNTSASKGANATYTQSKTTKILYSQANVENTGANIVKKVYAVFRPKFYLFSYNKEEDKFNTQAMNHTVSNGVFQYLDNIVEYAGGDVYYQILHTYSGELTVCDDEGDYEGFLEQIQGLTVLRVKPTNNASELDGAVILCVNGTPVAKLTIHATNEPIFVTLNPAEDFSGTYTYMQNTTGTQEFQVTTSSVLKQMITSTDYSFSFSPKPNNASTHQFEKWVIKNADGTVIYESVSPNLSYRFNGGESITPVFTSANRAVFIVKSEPQLKYIDLQAALDRAAELGRGQIVTVYAPQKLASSVKLVTGNYTIRNGVTLLIPGESTYTALTGDLEEKHFAPSGSLTSYCTLDVEDNTTITVEDGNISLYAKLAQINAGKNVGVYDHGHMHLGKNCQINVQAGGLYAFGFITGDKSSHITMESNTTVYEAFFTTDWRGGDETIGNWAPDVPVFGGDAGEKARVFPIGQYYVQSVEVPMTLKHGAKEKLSCCVNATVQAAVNMTFISTYDDTEGLFGLGPNTTITKVYDPETDRLKFMYEGNGVSSKVKVGCMELNMKVEFVGIPFTVKVNSKDYVMPIQNNMDIDVKNTTIDVKYDLACMPGSTMRVHDDAVINVESASNVYIYDRGARRIAEGTKGGYWGSSDQVIIPLGAKARPGGIQYGHKDGSGKFVAGRTEADLLDARLIINGDMNIYGGLYTVKGAYAGEDTEEPEGGADITSEGSGKINVYSLGEKSSATQWKQGAGAQSIALTSPKLLLHNDKSKGATAAYTPVNATGISYTYYQSDGTWSEPKAGITGVKFYDSNDKEIDSLLVTKPNPTTLNGYFLATLEQISGVSYNAADFTCTLTSDNLALTGARTIENGKLKIPVIYTVQNKHGKSSHILSITHASYDELKDTINVVEDYKPVFEVPSDLTIYGRVNETASGALSIKYDVANIVTVTNPANNPTNPKWNAVISGANPSYFGFQLGTTGNGIDNACVTFRPDNTTVRKAVLKLTAVYTDKSGAEISSETHTINLVGNGMIIDNTMEFNNVGAITTSNTNPFNLLRNVNSTGTLTCKIVNEDGSKTTVSNSGTYTTNEIVDIQYTTIDGKGNYIITPKAKVGQVTLEISQTATGSHSAKTITTTIMIVGEPQPLTTQVCLDDNTYKTLTEDIDHAKYDAATGRLNFTGDGVISSWTAQFSTAAGVMTFTPYGDGYWAVQESKDGVNWTEVIWWTQLPEGEQAYVSLTPTARRVKISYNKTNEVGYITDLCINPFTIHAEKDKIYVPLTNGVVQSTSVIFTHSSSATPTITPPTGWTASKSTSSNLGGVLHPYYQTTVTLSGGSGVAEQNDGFTLKATQVQDEAKVIIGTYSFPKPLPMASEDWKSDNSVANVNGYDESEYYYHYMVASKNVKWDAERQQIAFLNIGSKTGNDAVRQVVFGYSGLPDQLTFQSSTTDWTVKKSTNGTSWEDMDTLPTITTAGDVHTIVQPLTGDPQYIEITYNGTDQNEVLLNNLVVEGFPSAEPSSNDVIITKIDAAVTPSEMFTIHARNLPSMKLLLDRTDAFNLYYVSGSDETLLTNATELTDECLALNKEGNITVKAEWKGTGMLDEGQVKIINPGQNNSVMAVVRLVGKKSGITAIDANTGIWTGVPDGNQYGTTKVAHTLVDSKEIFVDYTYHQVNLAKAFANTKTLFDYLIIFGETTTTDNSTSITQPTADVGSNAKTPYYVYKKSDDNLSYEFVNAIANANSHEKGFDGTVIQKDSMTHIDIPNIGNGAVDSLRIYITGFCPYASTGYTKNEEGVFLFRGEHGDKLHIYLDSCHIYSRNKTHKGSTFYGDKEGGETYSDAYARGSGGVLVFENIDAREQVTLYDPFEVTVHTIGHNVLNSNHGCFFGLKVGSSVAMKAYQVSSPIQVHMFSKDHISQTRTTLNFDDLWPTAVHETTNNITANERTNGFLALKKQANNAPSIDLGNEHTEVNFCGGQVQLQNSQIGSDTYRTTLAISYRAGFFGAEEAGIQLCHGIGTDAVEGVVNFIDGTVTVEKMYVKPEFRQYYLMDTLADGTESEYTSCLRTPRNTYIKGGSVCRVRACQNVTSKGGGPREGVGGRLLGQYVYTFDNTKDTKNNNTGLATIAGFPGCVSDLDSYAYNLNSVTADANKQFYFWIPDGYGGVTAEQDVYMATWKACMTKIGAGIAEVASGEVGGDILIDEEEEVKYFLYCQLDQNIYDVINAGPVDANGNKLSYTYEAPIEVPSAAKQFFNGQKYTRWAPNLVGPSKQHEVTSEKPYTITNRVYYITTATADIWQTFTAPFHVQNIYVMETFKEEMLEDKTRAEVLQYQAQHNADFAAFFGVAMAMGTMNSFDQIYDSYIEWAKIQDKSMGIWNGSGEYTLRGKTKLIPYFGNNWRDANFYLNHNTGNWILTEGGEDEDGNPIYSFTPQWEYLTQNDTTDKILMHQGETYSLMFPYCTGCETSLENRTDWDYWSGKFLIFESTEGNHTINGREFLESDVFNKSRNSNEVVVTGNSTFAMLDAADRDIYVYNSGAPFLKAAKFEPAILSNNAIIYPTVSFLYGDVPMGQHGAPAKAISRTGQIIYDVDNNGDGTVTGGHIPTVGGGNDLFITATVAGINIAVAEAQHVRVMSATGAVLYNGMVQTAVDVALPANGVYVIAGENEVHKILF